MSVQKELDRIAQNVSNTYAVLDALGCEMPSEQTSDNLATTAGTSKVLLYKEQTLTEEQKEQVRKNIGVSDYDMVIECDGYDITDISNLTIIKGNALDVYNKCKNGENPKVVLWHRYASDDEIENVMPTAKIRITYWEEDYGNLYLTFTSDDGHYKTTYSINFSSDGLSTNTIDGAFEDFVNLGDVIHLPRTEDNWPNNGTAGQFAVSDGNGGITWLTVNDGNEVAY